eukprot:TRINITY_DN2593_c0_g1_i1.p1 TRINITY_DN2593_c0_g1~~TRINITY_DN2593_c0_g1_i1.p1  ORF type:complete len:469 (+),score=104.38 TRINITY_DN2593_c0_g1_i1:32-1408(+)
MKVKVISRNEKKFQKQNPDDLQPIFRNYSEDLHPFQAEREYVRALNSTKLDKLFSKPFISQLSLHSDGVFSLAPHPTRLPIFFSGSCDGELYRWNLTTKTVNWTVQAHSGYVRSICTSYNGAQVVTCSDDGTIKFWNVDQVDTSISVNGERINNEKGIIKPETTLQCDSPKCMAASPTQHLYAVGTDSSVDIYGPRSTEPLQKLIFDSAIGCNAVSYSPADPNLLASCLTDRALALYDVRDGQPMHRVIMKNRGNAVAFNPVEPVFFTMANDDGNAYTFDLRKLEKAYSVHKGHENSVMSVAYSPTGKEFVTGSFDRTIRLWKHGSGRSFDIYHSERMQRVFSVAYSQDARFILSGSDDANVRIWKAKANDSLRLLTRQEEERKNYENKLKARFKHVGQLKSIQQNHHLPRYLYNAQKKRAIQHKSQKRKIENKIKHSKPGTVEVIPEKQKGIVKTIE